MVEYKISEIASKLEMSHPKTKRYARDFLGPDLKAKKQSGYSRKLSEDEAFKIYIGGHLISRLAFSTFDAVEILNDLDWWLKKVGLYPGREPEQGDPDLDVKSWQVEIKTTRPKGFEYNAIGTIHHETKRTDPRYVHTKKYVEDMIPKTNPKVGTVEVDHLNVKIFRISLLRKFFDLGMKGKRPTFENREQWAEHI